MRITLTGMIVAIAAVGAAACGSSGSTDLRPSLEAPSLTAPVTTPSVVIGSGTCALITQDEAAMVVGSPVPSPIDSEATLEVNGTSLKEQFCLFGSEVLVARIDMGSAASELFTQYRDSLSSESDFEEVGGVGDEAFFAKGQLTLRQGDTGLILDVGQNTGQTSNEHEKEKTLAGIVLGRL